MLLSLRGKGFAASMADCLLYISPVLLEPAYIPKSYVILTPVWKVQRQSLRRSYASRNAR